MMHDGSVVAERACGPVQGQVYKLRSVTRSRRRRRQLCAEHQRSASLTRTGEFG